MTLPFDVNNDELLDQFINYVEECFTIKAEELTRPDLRAKTLSMYEEYYRKINLYYSFSKSMQLPFDEQWVYDARKETSNEINKLL